MILIIIHLTLSHSAYSQANKLLDDESLALVTSTCAVRGYRDDDKCTV